MIDSLLAHIAPHHCCGCGQMGTLLCDNCKYDITSEPFSACCACGNGLAGPSGFCDRCRLPYARAWCVAPRRDQLQQLIDRYKFDNARSAYRPLAELLHERLPQLPPQVKLVPVPTVSAHIRQRGYDHTMLIARRLARLRGLTVDTSLLRATNTMQRGATARQRTQQAKQAFVCTVQLDPEVTYLLIDDVITTGATVKYAAKTLREAGAATVWVAAVSRQPLD